MMTDHEQKSTSGDHHTAGTDTQNTLEIADAERIKVKYFGTLAARAEIKGHTLQKIGSGYLLSRWGCVQHCTGLDVVEQHLQQMGA